MVIRECKFQDNNTFARLWNYAYPENRITLTSILTADLSRGSEEICKRWAAECNGGVIGVIEIAHWSTYIRPDNYLLHVIVSPENQGKGIGKQLFDYANRELEQLQPKIVRAFVREDRTSGINLLASNGFNRDKLRWNFWLDTADLNLEPFSDTEDALEESGIEVKCFSEFRNDTNYLEHLYELYKAALRDINSPDMPKQMLMSEFCETIAQNEDVAGNSMLAKFEDIYIGMWVMAPKPASTILGNMMIVDRIAYRKAKQLQTRKLARKGRSLAFGLAYHGLKNARDKGFNRILFWTDEFNHTIVGIGEMLGFKRWPAQLIYKKEFK